MDDLVRSEGGTTSRSGGFGPESEEYVRFTGTLTKTAGSLPFAISKSQAYTLTAKQNSCRCRWLKSAVTGPAASTHTWSGHPRPSRRHYLSLEESAQEATLASTRELRTQWQRAKRAHKGPSNSPY